MRKALVGLLVAVALVVPAVSATAVPKGPPMTPCIKAYMELGFNYKTAKRLCYAPQT